MNQLAIVYHSAHGHTEHIARHVAEGARNAATLERVAVPA
jgi:NAD(P)H dehydrogenase (quinone)